MSEGIPIPNPEKEVTQEDWEKLRSLSQSMMVKIDSYPRGYNNYAHISGNIGTIIGSVDLYQKNKMNDRYDTALFNAKALEEYFSLLEDFPEFKEKEITNIDGMFPDIPNAGVDNASAKYVVLASERLRNK